MAGGCYAILIAFEHDGYAETLKTALASRGFAGILNLTGRPYYEVLRRINEVFDRARPEDLVLIWYRGKVRSNRAGRLHLLSGDSVDELLESTSLPLEQIGRFAEVSEAARRILILDYLSLDTAGGARGELERISRDHGIGIITGVTAQDLATWIKSCHSALSNLLDYARNRLREQSLPEPELYAPEGWDGLTIGSSLCPDTARLSFELVKVLPDQGKGILSIAFSPGGRWLAAASANGSLNFLELALGATRSISAAHDGPACAVRFDSYGGMLATAGVDRKIRLWDVASRSPGPVLTGHAGAVLSLAVSPEGNLLASGGYGGIIRLWDLQGGVCRREWDSGQEVVSRLTFNPNGCWLASSGRDGTIRLWELASGAPVHTLAAHHAQVNDLRFTPGGRALVSCGRDTRIKVWNAADWKLAGVLKGHQSPVLCLDINDDGTLLVSGSAAGEIILWDLASNASLGKLDGGCSAVQCIEFSRDGNILAAGSAGGTLRIWERAKARYSPRFLAKAEPGAVRQREETFMTAQKPSREDSAKPRVHITYDVKVGDQLLKRELPFVIGVLADLLGNPKEPPLRPADRKFITIDLDNFDNVLSRLAPRLEFDVENTLAPGATPLHVELYFRAMADFEPVNVARQVAPLNELLELRTRLANLRACLNNQLEDILLEVVHTPETLKEAVADGGAGLGILAGRIVDEGCLGRTADEHELGERWIEEFLRQVLNGEIALAKDAEAMLSPRIRSIDGSLSLQLAKIMHAPAFQALEAAWRGLEYLVSRSETSAELKIRVLHFSKRELLRDLRRASVFDQSCIFAKVYTDEYQVIGGEPYSLLIGDYCFNADAEDMDLLEGMSHVAAASYAPFIAAASPELFQMQDFTQLNLVRDLSRKFTSAFYTKWNSFRASEDAKFVGLVAPRILLRRPYEITPSEVDAFEYQESAGGRAHAGYLWGNGAFAFASRVAQAFSRYGWGADIRGATGGCIEGLPVHTYMSEDGDLEVQCPTEIAIGEQRESELVRLGIIPLLHRKNTDMAVFFDTPSCHRPQRFDIDEATRHAGFAARLEYTLTMSRFVHCLKAIVRDQSGRFASAAEWADYLSEWISQYVGACDETTGAFRPSFPLSGARLEVQEVPGQPGCFRAVAFLEPWHQLNAKAGAIRAVFWLGQV